MTTEDFLAKCGDEPVRFSTIFNSNVTMKLIGESMISVYGKLRKDSLIFNNMTVNNFHDEIDDFKFTIK